MQNTASEVSVNEVRDLLDRGEPLLLLDVRDPDEHNFCRIEGAVLVPLDQIPDRLFEIRDLAGGRAIVTYCHLGRRSLMAARYLCQQGLANVRSMAGGIEAWSVEIDPTVPRYD
jgi:rhodanese-related sulfurtransferase